MIMQQNIRDLDYNYIAGTYNRFPIVLRHGKGSLVYDENEKAYIDLSSGIAVNTFGFADEAWQTAVTAQLGTLQHTSNLYYSEPCALLASTPNISPSPVTDRTPAAPGSSPTI